MSFQKFSGLWCCEVYLGPRHWKINQIFRNGNISTYLQQSCKALLLWRVFLDVKTRVCLLFFSIFHIYSMTQMLHFMRFNLTPNAINDKRVTSDFFFSEFPIEAVIDPYSVSLTRYCKESPYFVMGELMEQRSKAVTSKASINRQRW